MFPFCWIFDPIFCVSKHTSQSLTIKSSIYSWHCDRQKRPVHRKLLSAQKEKIIKQHSPEWELLKVFCFTGQFTVPTLSHFFRTLQFKECCFFFFFTCINVYHSATVLLILIVHKLLIHVLQQCLSCCKMLVFLQ